MDLYFCDICDESIPVTDLDRGMAFRRGDRVVCAACDNSMSPKSATDAVDGQAASAIPEAAAGSAETPSPSQVAATGSAVPVTSPPGSASVGFLKFALLGLLVFFASQERSRLIGVQERSQASIDGLLAADESADQRFSDFQTTISRSDQEQAISVNAQVLKVSGDSEAGLVNLRARLGRIENSLEALRQEGVKDRQSLGEELRGLEAELSVSKGGFGELAGVVEGIGERTASLEDLLQGGLSLGPSLDAKGKAPRWAATLVDLTDASAGNRWTAVTALGDTGDKRVVPHLLPMLKDDDVWVRMAAARVLGELGSLEAVSALIGSLGDVQVAVREVAVVSLRLISGKDFRFDPLGKESDRDKARAAWRKWDEQRRG